MITGLFLKNYKIYKKQRFVPIASSHRWTAFVGPNGAGKSSILEALDTFFNGADWNVNKTARKNNETTNFINLPFVCPLFLIEKSKWNSCSDNADTTSATEAASNYLWNAGNKSATPVFHELHEHIRRLKEAVDQAEYYLVPSGVRFGIDRSRPYFGPLHQQSDFIRHLGIEPTDRELDQLEQAKTNDELIAQRVGNINAVVDKIYDYIYIPSDITVADYTKLETNSMQVLMGRDINKEISRAIPRATLDNINRSLDETVEEATNGLDLYRYEKPTGGKKKITINTLSGLITKEYFSIRELARVQKDGTAIPVSNLSSGEQRRALIDLTSNYLTKRSDIHQNTILAIDEPEISLHTSLCYDQFEMLFDVARSGPQCIVTTHWYGFLPIAQSGDTHFVERNDASESVRIDSYDLKNYRERATKKNQADSRGEVPFDISLKSANDLVQSIAASLRLEAPYSWILCEGASEQLYFSHFFAKDIAARRLRLLPLGGAGEVLNIYRYLEAALADKTFAKGGKVLAIIDTDEQLIQHSTQSKTKNLAFRRLLLSKSDELLLLPIDSNVVSPATDIEDCLDAKLFLQVLGDYAHSEHGLDLKGSTRDGAKHSGKALDLKDTERKHLKTFFANPGRKVEFARKYVRAAKEAAFPADEGFISQVREHLRLNSSEAGGK